MAYAPPALRRRTRRRRTLAVVLIVAVLFGIVALAVASRTDRRLGVDYLDSAKEIADDEALLAAGLAEIFTGLGDFERQDILDRLTDLSDSAAELRQRLADLELTTAVGEVHGYLTVAVGSWDDALGLLEAAVVEVVDGRDVQTGDSMLENAFDLLRIGDRAYFGFTEALTRLDPELLTQEFNEVAFAGGERNTLYNAEVIGGRLRGSNVLEGDHDVSLVASIDPEPLVEPGSVPIVPNAETFIVNLVITNSGNLVEERILVSLVGTPQSDDAEVIDLQQIVPFLDPSASTNVIFDLSDLVVPGVLYELRAAVTIAQDDNPEDNVWSIVLVRNAE